MVRIKPAELRRVALKKKLSQVLRDIEAGARKTEKQREMIANSRCREADMNRAALEEQFSMAKENVRWDIEQVRKQREKVEWLERGGHDAAQARKVLDTAEDLLLLHMADREPSRRNSRASRKRAHRGISKLSLQAPPRGTWSGFGCRLDRL